MYTGRLVATVHSFGPQPPYLPASFQKIETEEATACIDPSLPPPANAASRAFFFAYYQQQARMHATWLAIVLKIYVFKKSMFPEQQSHQPSAATEAWGGG